MPQAIRRLVREDNCPGLAASPARSAGANPAGTPFRSAEEAWFWTAAALVARHEGARRAGPGTPRPCEPDDVARCLDVLYRRRRIDLSHARILRIWGERGFAPDPGYAAERAEAQLWREALDRLDYVLRVKGIVA